MQMIPRGLYAIRRPQTVRLSRGRPRKLTAEQVATIRALAPNHRYNQIAKMFGVSTSTISSIARGKTWAVASSDPVKYEAPRRRPWYWHIPPLILLAMRLHAEARSKIPAIGSGIPRKK
jgi:hypothetical protein